MSNMEVFENEYRDENESPDIGESNVPQENMEADKACDEVSSGTDSRDGESQAENAAFEDMETDPTSETNSEDTIESTHTAEKINAENAALSTGPISDDGQAAPFFSASDVRAMTREQVKANYDRIILSMKSKKFYG